MIVGGNHKVLIRLTHHSKRWSTPRCWRAGHRRQCRDVGWKMYRTQRSLAPERFKKWRFFTLRELVGISCNRRNPAGYCCSEGQEKKVRRRKFAVFERLFARPALYRGRW